MNVAYLCLGGNIGDRESALRLALVQITEKAGALKAVSSLYETEAWGVENQQPYLNVCAMIETERSATELLQTLLFIEKTLGRERNASAGYEPRTLDIDILFYNDAVIHTDQLSIPHPRLHLRQFVLVPLNSIAPDYLHPVLNKTIFNLLKDCPDHSHVKLYQ